MSGDESQALRQVRNARSEADVRSALQRALMAANGSVGLVRSSQEASSCR